MPKQTETYEKTFIKTFGKPIIEYDAFKRAIESLNNSTKHQYTLELPKYFIYLNQNPDQVIQQRKTDLNLQNEESEYYERKTSTFIKQLLKNGKSGLYTKTTLGRIQGFFSNNSRRYALDMRNLKIPKNRKKQKYSPSNEELRYLYNIADNVRNRLLISLMYHTGASPIDVASLNLDDLPVETWSYFERSRSKTGEIWRGVITPDISRDLTAYLTVRNTDTDIKNKKLFIGHKKIFTSRTCSDALKDLFIKAGMGKIKGLKPTSLRDAFEDALVQANVNSKIKEALMGHTSDIEHDYGGASQARIMCIEALKKTYPLIMLGNLGFERQNGLNEEIEVLKERIQKLEDQHKEVILLNYESALINLFTIPENERFEMLKHMQVYMPELFEEPLYSEIKRRVGERGFKFSF